MTRRNALVTREEELATEAVVLTDTFSETTYYSDRVNADRKNVAGIITRELVGISPVWSPPDPIRQGDTPARHPEMYVRTDDPRTSHNPHYVAPDDASGGHTFSPPPGADMPVGMFLDQNERRRLDDGRHA